MLRTTLFLTSLATLLIGCGKFTVKVDPRSKTKSDNTSEISSFEPKEARGFSLSDVEVYLAELDEIKTTDASVLTQKLQQGLRKDLRKALRDVRGNLIRNADGRQSYSKSIFSSLDQKLCRQLKPQDFAYFEGFEVLGTLLKTAVLTNLDPISAAKLNPGLPTKIDDITVLVLTELGVSARGQTTVTMNGDHLLTKSEIVWRIINEIGEEDYKDEDEYGIRLSLTREEGPNDFQALSLRIDVAKGLFESTYSNADADLYFMELLSLQKRNEWGGLELSLNARSGFAMMGQDLYRYNRKLQFSQENPSLDLFRFQDTNRYKMSGQSTRTAVLDLQALKACVDDLDDAEELPDTDLPFDDEDENDGKDPTDPGKPNDGEPGNDQPGDGDNDGDNDGDDDEDEDDDPSQSDYDPTLPPFGEDDPSQSD